MAVRKTPARKAPARRKGPTPRARPVESITADELAYHSLLLTQKRAADTAWNSWASHLVAKYGLGEAGTIDPQGQIVRSDPPPTTT